MQRCQPCTWDGLEQRETTITAVKPSTSNSEKKVSFSLSFPLFITCQEGDCARAARSCQFTEHEEESEFGIKI